MFANYCYRLFTFCRCHVFKSMQIGNRKVPRDCRLQIIVIIYYTILWKYE